MNKVFVIGLGAGDSGLITLKAYEILKGCDVVITPKSKLSPRSVALEIVKDIVEKDRIEFFNFPTTNDEGDLKEAYDREANRIKQLISQGKRVAYTTIGDVSIYSTFNYLSERLTHLGVDFEIVEGVPSFISLANRVKKPLVLKGESFAVVELKEGVDKIVRLFELVDTVVVMKIGGRIRQLFELIRSVKLEYAYLGSRLYLEGERIIDLMDAKQDEISDAYLSVAILKRLK
ncbi:precorrin-2 C(20)-methyltransferase [Hippea maritima]|uniref:Precorrin-2 C20-methyltransferase n=1 Tax=Hippea maritima (strain ATCC 700847 / DSM 10411 / MH2) TaxID=760142 RepID=F2LU96_HIPMA|nr:precorrin-2 C(20)-methyltransferase [Hippea maritima]AEA34559.1 precorrin-2 C20-methyltransferase [Hippea maritima DSM 10411]